MEGLGHWCLAIQRRCGYDTRDAVAYRTWGTQTCGCPSPRRPDITLAAPNIFNRRVWKKCPANAIRRLLAQSPSDVDHGSQSASGSKRGAPLSSDSHPPQGSKGHGLNKSRPGVTPNGFSSRLPVSWFCRRDLTCCLKHSSLQASCFGVACTSSAWSMEMRQTALE